MADNAAAAAGRADSMAGDGAPTPSQGWTIIFLCAGIAVIAACLLIPEADETRRLVYQNERLKADLQHIEKQIESNRAFIERVGTDPALAERLAQRQMKLIRKGSQVLELKRPGGVVDRSPLSIPVVPPPAPPPEMRPTGGKFSELCRAGKSRLYMIGGGLMLLAMGLVLGAGQASRD